MYTASFQGACVLRVNDSFIFWETICFPDEFNMALEHPSQANIIESHLPIIDLSFPTGTLLQLSQTHVPHALHLITAQTSSIVHYGSSHLGSFVSLSSFFVRFFIRMTSSSFFLLFFGAQWTAHRFSFSVKTRSCSCFNVSKSWSSFSVVSHCASMASSFPLNFVLYFSCSIAS